jgi:hypothetical protein
MKMKWRGAVVILMIDRGRNPTTSIGRLVDLFFCPQIAPFSARASGKKSWLPGEEPMKEELDEGSNGTRCRVS